MISILLAGGVALLLVLIGTPIAIRALRSKNYGQNVREDGPRAHFVKSGTPTMGGLVIIAGAIIAYLVAHLAAYLRPDSNFEFSESGLLALATIAAMGLLGFVDDYIKISRRRSLGLNKRTKFLGQLIIAIGFAALSNYTQIVQEISFVRPLGVALGLDLNVLFVAWIFIILSAASNGVNLADGLDGLASGSGALVMAAYVVIAFWQARHSCLLPSSQSGCYQAPHSLDIAVVAASMLGASAGFLWWNAAPAKIFMGDTGSFALGGAMAALAVLTNTQLLLIVLGGLYVVEVSSVVVQVISFKVFRRRVFLMAPIHHHFELLGWPEFTVIVRFWILSGLAVAFALGLFYAEFIAVGGVD